MEKWDVRWMGGGRGDVDEEGGGVVVEVSKEMDEVGRIVGMEVRGRVMGKDEVGRKEEGRGDG